MLIGLHAKLLSTPQRKKTAAITGLIQAQDKKITAIDNLIAAKAKKIRAIELAQQSLVQSRASITKQLMSEDVIIAKRFVALHAETNARQAIIEAGEKEIAGLAAEKESKRLADEAALSKVTLEKEKQFLNQSGAKALSHQSRLFRIKDFVREKTDPQIILKEIQEGLQCLTMDEKNSDTRARYLAYETHVMKEVPLIQNKLPATSLPVALNPPTHPVSSSVPAPSGQTFYVLQQMNPSTSYYPGHSIVFFQQPPTQSTYQIQPQIQYLQPLPPQQHWTPNGKRG